MSSLVLLNRDGVVERKLKFVSLPADYVVPEGMTISWMIGMHLASRIPRPFELQEPAEAYFYLGDAWAQVSRSTMMSTRDARLEGFEYNSRELTVIVQGTSAKDVNTLRDHIMHLINTRTHWGVRNDLNPKPGFFKRLFRASR